jgi:hypothetical protein
MRWIKHMTAARSDKAMALVSEIHGPVAIGIYWGLIEEIAGPMEPGKMTPSASHSVAKWASILDTSSRTFTKICKSLQTESLIFCETIGDRLTISIPNILKYKDEYARKSGQTQEQEQKQIRADTEQIQNRAPEPEPPAADVLVLAAPEPKQRVRKPKAEAIPESPEFVEFYRLYPRHVGRGPAWLAWQHHVHNGDAPKVIAGLKAALPALNRAEEDKRPYPATWLDQERWRDCEGLNGATAPRSIYRDHIAKPRPANAEEFKFEIPKGTKA